MHQQSGDHPINQEHHHQEYQWVPAARNHHLACDGAFLIFVEALLQASVSQFVLFVLLQYSNATWPIIDNLTRHGIRLQGTEPWQGSLMTRHKYVIYSPACVAAYRALHGVLIIG